MEQLSAMDAALLELETRTNLMVITGLMILGAPIPLDRLKAIVEDRLVPIRRFRQRIVRTERPLAALYWQDAPDFDLSQHVQQVTLPLPAGHDVSRPEAESVEQAALEDLVSVLASTPLDRSKPLWTFHLVERYKEGCAVIVRIHHSIGDGMALMEVLLSITDADPDASLAGPSLEKARPWDYMPTLPPGGKQRAVRRTRRIARKLAYKSVSFADDPSQLRSLVRTSCEAAEALGEIMLAPPDSQTAFKGKLGVHKRVAWSGPIALADVKAAGRRLGGTVNDVMVAGVSGALRRYLQERGQPVEEINLRAAVLVNLRQPGTGGELGNRIGTVFLPLPVGVDDSVLRLQAVKRSMDGLKNSLQARVTHAMVRAMGLAPPDLQRSIASLLDQKATAMMTNVVGPPDRRYLAGAPLKALVAWVPKSGGLALSVGILSYAGQLRLGIMTDQGLVPDPQAIIAAFQDELETLVALARNAGEKPSIRDTIAMLDRALAMLGDTGMDGVAMHEKDRK